VNDLKGKGYWYLKRNFVDQLLEVPFQILEEARIGMFEKRSDLADNACCALNDN